MEPIILTFRIRGRQARAKLPASLPQELSDALENCLHWIPAPLSHMPGLCLCDESCIQRWTERVPDRPLARRLCRMLLLSGFLLSSLQAVKQIWSVDDGGSAYYEAKGIAGLMIFENLVFRAILFVASLLFPTTQVYSTAVSIPYLVVGLLLLLILYLGWGGYSKNT